MISVQAAGCAPIVKAFEEGKEKAEPWPEPHTMASGLRVPSAIGDFLMLRAIRESDGRAIAVEEERLAHAVTEIGRMEGVFAAPEGAATLLALERLLDDHQVSASDRIVLFNTGTGLKYLEGLGLG